MMSHLQVFETILIIDVILFLLFIGFRTYGVFLRLKVDDMNVSDGIKALSSLIFFIFTCLFCFTLMYFHKNEEEIFRYDDRIELEHKVESLNKALIEVIRKQNQ